MKLYNYFRSSASFRVRIALEGLGKHDRAAGAAVQLLQWLAQRSQAAG